MIVKKIGKAKKLQNGVYRVTFSKTQVYVVSIPTLFLEMGYSEKELKNLAIDRASENLSED